MTALLNWLDGLSDISFFLLICIGLCACQIAYAMSVK